MYGPPGGGQYPGAPQDPWQGGGTGDAYGGSPYGTPPAGQPPGGDPYGQQPYGQPTNPSYGPPSGAPYGQPSGVPYTQPYGQPGTPYDPYGQPSGPPADQWGMGQQPMPPMSGPPWGPPPAPPKNNSGLAVGLSAVAVLVVLIGAVLIFLVVNRGDGGTPGAGSSPSASATPSETPSSEAPSDGPTKFDIDDAEEGDCLYDSNPSSTKASLSFVDCSKRGQDHYRVLERFDNTTDASKCDSVSGYDTSFTSDSGQFVLCVEELE